MNSASSTNETPFALFVPHSLKTGVINCLNHQRKPQNKKKIPWILQTYMAGSSRFFRVTFSIYLSLTENRILKYCYDVSLFLGFANCKLHGRKYSINNNKLFFECEKCGSCCSSGQPECTIITSLLFNYMESCSVFVKFLVIFSGAVRKHCGIRSNAAETVRECIRYCNYSSRMKKLISCNNKNMENLTLIIHCDEKVFGIEERRTIYLQQSLNFHLQRSIVHIAKKMIKIKGKIAWTAIRSQRHE